MELRTFSLLMLSCLAAALPVLGACATTSGGGPRRDHPPEDYQLELGPAEWRGQLVTLRQGDIYWAAEDRVIGFEELVEQLGRARVVLIGERHTVTPHHEVEVRVVRALTNLHPNRLAIGLEMYPRDVQPVLDRYVAGELDEEAFLAESAWDKHWGYPFCHYRELFRIAVERRVPLVGLNAPGDVVRRIGRGGLDALDDPTRRALPDLHLDSADHRQLFRILMGLPPTTASHRQVAHGTHHTAQLEHLYQAQVVWDETMAESILRATSASGTRDHMAVIAGKGHFVYGLGINYRLQRRAPALTHRSLICLTAPEPGGTLWVARGLGDFVWVTRPDPEADARERERIDAIIEKRKRRQAGDGGTPHGSSAKDHAPGGAEIRPAAPAMRHDTDSTKP